MNIRLVTHFIDFGTLYLNICTNEPLLQIFCYSVAF